MKKSVVLVMVVLSFHSLVFSAQEDTSGQGTIKDRGVGIPNAGDIQQKKSEPKAAGLVRTLSNTALNALAAGAQALTGKKEGDATATAANTTKKRLFSDETGPNESKQDNGEKAADDSQKLPPRRNCCSRVMAATWTGLCCTGRVLCYLGQEFKDAWSWNSTEAELKAAEEKKDK